MKKFFLFFTLVAMLFTACEPVSNGGEEADAELKPVSETSMEFDAAAAFGKITYKLTNPRKGVTVQARTEAVWIKDFDYQTEGEISFKVEANNEMQSREAIIRVSYGGLGYNVTVFQQGLSLPKEVTVEPPILCGHYYGIQAGFYNYYLAFSDKGMSSNVAAYGIYYFNVPNAYYYLLDVFTHTAPTDNNYMLPDGEYTHQYGGEGMDNFFTIRNSWYQKNGNDGKDILQPKFNTAKLTVADGTVTLVAELDIPYTVVMDPETGETITITNTETHTVTFKGDYSLLDMTGVEYPEPEE